MFTFANFFNSIINSSMSFNTLSRFAVSHGTSLYNSISLFILMKKPSDKLNHACTSIIKLIQ